MQTATRTCRLAVLVATFLITQPTRAAEIELASSTMALRFSPAGKGALHAVVDRASGSQFLAPGRSSLFRLTVVREDGKPETLTEADARSWRHRVRRHASGQELELIYDGVGGGQIDVRCRVSLGASASLSRWRATVRNRSRWALRSIECPAITAAPQLGTSGEDDVIVMPVHHGQLLRAPGRNLPSRSLVYVYPGDVSVQMLAYYDGAAGLYAATYDREGSPKQFGLERTGNGIRLVMENRLPETPGGSWAPDYDTVLGTFHGDWCAAAEIYRDWAEQQPWCARKLGSRGDIPTWYLRGLPMVMFFPGMREIGRAEAPGALPQAPALFRKLAASLRSPVVVIEYGWERWGSWVGPDVFPPYGGEAAFARHAKALAQDGNVIGAYVSGTRWAIGKPGQPYNGEAEFRRRALDAAVLTPDRQLDVENRQYARNVRLCIGHPKTTTLISDQVNGLAERGVPFVQLDQNLGGQAFPCYDRRHGHSPGAGRYLTDGMRELFRQLRKTGKERHPGFALTIEEPCEFFIPYLDGYNSRPYVYAGFPMVGVPEAESVPLFSYLYHEYALGFGGDMPVALESPEADVIQWARTSASGLLVEGPALGPGHELPERETAYLASLVDAQQNFAREYLILGRMLPPPVLDQVPLRTVTLFLLRGVSPYPRPNLKFPAGAGSYFEILPWRGWAPGPKISIPVVYGSAWRSQAGRVGYVVYNTATVPVRPRLRLSGGRTITQALRKVSSRNSEQPLVLAGAAGGIELPLEPLETALFEEVKPHSGTVAPMR